MVSFLNALLGFFSIKKNIRNSNVNKSLSIIAFVCSLWSFLPAIVYIRASMGLSFDLLYRACWVGWLAIPAAMQFACFLEDENSRLARQIGYIFYPFWGIVLILCLTTDWVEQGVYSLIPYVDRYGPLERPARLIGTLSLFWLVYKFYKIRQKTYGIKKLQLNYFLLISMVFAGGSAFASGLFQLMGGFGFEPTLTSYFSIFWVASTFYAITRYRLFDIHIFISRSIFLILVLFIVTVIHTIIFKILEPFVGVVISTLLSFFVIGSILGLTSFFSGLQRNINQLILKDKYNYQNLLKEFSKSIVTILEPSELFNHLVEAIKNSLKVERIFLFLKDKDDFYRIYFKWQTKADFAVEQTLDPYLIEWLEKKKEIFICEEQSRLWTEDKFKELFSKTRTLGAELVAPLIFKNQLIGMLVLGGKGDGTPYLKSDIEILETLANQAAIAIENARLYSEAITDGLTGVYHQKYLLIRLREEKERARRYGASFGLLMVDIDHFKKINDTYGHLTGDSVLCAVADLFKKHTRLTDVVARYGGDEFLILLPNIQRDGLISLGERIRKELEGSVFQDGLRVTISIGAKCFSAEDKDLLLEEEALVKKVDEALYLAKQKGRNRLEFIS